MQLPAAAAQTLLVRQRLLRQRLLAAVALRHAQCLQNQEEGQL